MIEELLMNVVNAMSSCLDEEQLDKLQNVLYINFHDVRVVEEKNELQATGTDSDTVKMRLFVASKKVSGRQDNTLAQDRKSTRLNSSHNNQPRMPSSA